MPAADIFFLSTALKDLYAGDEQVKETAHHHTGLLLQIKPKLQQNFPSSVETETGSVCVLCLNLGLNLVVRKQSDPNPICATCNLPAGQH